MIAIIFTLIDVQRAQRPRHSYRVYPGRPLARDPRLGHRHRQMSVEEPPQHCAGEGVEGQEEDSTQCQMQWLQRLPAMQLRAHFLELKRELMIYLGTRCHELKWEPAMLLGARLNQALNRHCQTSVAKPQHQCAGEGFELQKEESCCLLRHPCRPR